MSCEEWVIPSNIKKDRFILECHALLEVKVHKTYQCYHNYQNDIIIYRKTVNQLTVAVLTTKPSNLKLQVQGYVQLNQISKQVVDRIIPS